MEQSHTWFGELPKHWVMQRIKTLFDLRDERSYLPLEEVNLISLYANSGVHQHADIEHTTGNKARNADGYKVVKKEDIIVNILLCWMGAIGRSDYDGVTSPAYDVYKPKDGVNSHYYHYLFRTPLFSGECYKAGKGIMSMRWRTYSPQFRTIVVPVPPRTEQDQIVRFLDWKVSAINRLIKSYHHRIELISLMEQKIINDYLTHGCRKNRNLKKVTDNVTSRWMSDIPDNWKESKIGRHFVIKKRIAGREGYPVLSITQRGIKEKDIASNEGQMASNYSGYQFVYPGDFAMNHMDLLTGYIGIASQLGVTSPDYRVFALEDTDNCYAPYYLLLFQLCYKRRIFYAHGRGAAAKGRWRFPADNFKRFIIPLPPINEQREIVESIKPIQIKSAKLIANIEKKIETLTELKTRLIVDTVTGKIDVRNIEIPEYEFVREESQAEEEFDAEGSDNGE